MATLVAFEQENLTSPIKLSFRTIQKLPIAKEISLSYGLSGKLIVLWRDYLIGTFARTQPRACGLYIWSMGENTIFYFEVCHSFFPFPSALSPNSRQMESVPRFTKILDDVLFVSFDTYNGTRWTTACSCIHIPSLVISAQLPGGSLSLAEIAFDILQPKCIMEFHAMGSISSVNIQIYSIPACPPTHPRYCFIVKRFQGRPLKVDWEVLEVEIDLSIPGPIKIFSTVSQQYTLQRPTILLHDSDDDLFLYLQLGRGDRPCSSISIQFLRVGKPGRVRIARLAGVDKMHLSALSVDRDAGYVILWAREDLPESTRGSSYICWLDERKPGNMVYSRTKKLISKLESLTLRRV